MKYYTLNITRTVLQKDQEPLPATPPGIVTYVKTYCYTPQNAWREQAYLVFLSKDGQILGHFLLGMGGFSAVTIDKRLACIAMLGANAPRAVLVHNHPDGDSLPSAADLSQTKDLKVAFSAIGCELCDHIILGKENYFSFNNETQQKYSK